MKPLLSLDELSRLGLSRVHCSPAVSLDPGEPTVGYGFVSSGEITLDALRLAGAAHATWGEELEFPLAREIGARLRQHDTQSSIFLLTFERPVTLHAQEADAAVSVEDGGRTVVFDHRRLSTPHVLVDDRRCGIALQSAEGQLQMAQILPQVEVPSIPSIGSDVRALAQQIADAWLYGQIERKLALEHPWQHAAAVGMLVRLREPATGSLDTFLEGLREGTWRPPEQPARDWARQLAPEQLEYLENTTLAAIDLLLDDVDAALGARARGDARWLHDALEILLTRDDIESVRNLLAIAGHDSRLHDALEVLDARGELLADALDPLLVAEHSAVFEDERLRRAIDVNPDGWWVRPRSQVRT